jgi:hypothetical protein
MKLLHNKLSSDLLIGTFNSTWSKLILVVLGKRSNQNKKFKRMVNYIIRL